MAAQRGYYQKNKQARLEYAKKYREDNRERILAEMREYRKNNPEKFQHNTPERKLKHRERQQLRRARLRESGTSVVYSVVFDRDNYTCQRCGISCPPEAVWPAPNFPSLDHIIPVSRGGAHTYENTQCLCLSCNLSKGANYEERPANVK